MNRTSRTQEQHYTNNKQHSANAQCAYQNSDRQHYNHYYCRKITKKRVRTHQYLPTDDTCQTEPMHLFPVPCA